MKKTFLFFILMLCRCACAMDRPSSSSITTRSIRENNSGKNPAQHKRKKRKNPRKKKVTFAAKQPESSQGLGSQARLVTLMPQPSFYNSDWPCRIAMCHKSFRTQEEAWEHMANIHSFVAATSSVGCALKGVKVTLPIPKPPKALYKVSSFKKTGKLFTPISSNSSRSLLLPTRAYSDSDPSDEEGVFGKIFTPTKAVIAKPKNSWGELFFKNESNDDESCPNLSADFKSLFMNVADNDPLSEAASTLESIGNESLQLPMPKSKSPVSFFEGYDPIESGNSEVDTNEIDDDELDLD